MFSSTKLEKGIVLDENCNPVSGAIVKYSDYERRFPLFPFMVSYIADKTRRSKTSSDGTFTIKRKHRQIKFLAITKDGYECPSLKELEYRSADGTSYRLFFLYTIPKKSDNIMSHSKAVPINEDAFYYYDIDTGSLSTSCSPSADLIFRFYPRDKELHSVSLSPKTGQQVKVENS